MLIKLECWRKTDCCRVEMNLATLTSWGYYQNFNVGVSLSKDKSAQYCIRRATLQYVCLFTAHCDSVSHTSIKNDPSEDECFHHICDTLCHIVQTVSTCIKIYI